MGHDGWLESLRRAARDPGALGRVLADGLPSDALQQIGDALLSVDDLAATNLAGVAGRLIEALHTRGWDGDQELAVSLAQAIEQGVSDLRPLPVELDDIGDALNQSAGSENYVDLQTGMVWLHSLTDAGMDDELDINFEDETRWLFLQGQGSHEAHRDLQRFIATVPDRELAERLTRAIEGRGAFRRFRSVLEHDPSEYTRWHRYDADARVGHARSWFAAAGYRALPLRRDALP
jgi:hypothetical protein